jgi:DNA-directed RNA polymerase subunit RPC12/RpoP
MKCIDCKSTNTRVISTEHPDDEATWRYVRCIDCGTKFKTEERYAQRLKSGPKKGSKIPNFRPHEPAIGERVFTSVLTESNVIHLRQLAASGHSRLALAKRFGISPSTVDRIIKRKTWKHI